MATATGRRSPGEGSVGPYLVGKKRLWRYKAGVVVLGDGTRVPYKGKGQFTRKGDAEQALAEVRAAARAGEVVNLTTVTTGEQLDALLATVRNAKTRHLYDAAIRCWLKPYVGAVPLSSLDSGHIVSLIRALDHHGKRGGKPLGAGSVGRAVVVLGAAIQMAVDAEQLKRGNPARSKAVRKEVTAIEKEEARQKAEAAKLKWWSRQQLNRFLAWASENDMHGYLMWRVYAFSGIRNFEGLALQWRDIQDGKLRLRVTKGGKPRKRRIPLDRVTVRMLAEYREERRALSPALAADEAFIFGDENGVPPSVSVNSKRFSRAVARCRASLGDGSLPPLTVHGLRHSFASLLLMQRKPVTYVAELLGDTVEMVSETYRPRHPRRRRQPLSGPRRRG
jgi:integrase